MVWRMRSRASFVTVTLVLATCIACPLVEMFDQWDDTLQSGNDTEYALVVLALCVGVAYLFARFIPKLSVPRFLLQGFSDSQAAQIVPVLMKLDFSVLTTISPPALPLRV